MTVMPGTAVTTRTKIEMQEDYEDFESAWAVVCKRVDEFVDSHPNARITIDDHRRLVTPHLRASAVTDPKRKPSGGRWDGWDDPDYTPPNPN